MEKKYKTDGGTDGLPPWRITEPEVPSLVKTASTPESLREQIAAMIHLEEQNRVSGHLREHPSWDEGWKQKRLEQADTILALPKIKVALKIAESVPEGKYCNEYPGKVCDLLVSVFPNDEIESHCPFGDRELETVKTGVFNGFDVGSYLKCKGCLRPEGEH